MLIFLIFEVVIGPFFLVGLEERRRWLKVFAVVDFCGHWEGATYLLDIDWTMWINVIEIDGKSVCALVVEFGVDAFSSYACENFTTGLELEFDELILWKSSNFQWHTTS